jgi:glutathione S-transferase/GST-like protein
MSTYKLYWREGSGSLVPEVALALCGAPVEHIRVDTDAGEHYKPAFLALNPAAQIPVLITPDGTVLSETAAMAIALAETFPQAGLLPPAGSAARAIALRWLMLLATTGYSAALRAYRPERYSGDAATASCVAVQAAALAESDKVFTILAGAAKGPFLLGKTLTIVDVYLAMLADWHPPALGIAAIRRIYDGVLADPVIAKAWARHEQAAPPFN